MQNTLHIILWPTQSTSRLKSPAKTWCKSLELAVTDQEYSWTDCNFTVVCKCVFLSQGSQEDQHLLMGHP